MATLTYDSSQTLAKFRVFSLDKTKTWDGSAMTAHASVSNYGTSGVLTPTTAADSAGAGSITKHTVTLPSLPDGDYWLAGFATTPAIGGYWTGDYDAGLKPFTIQDGAIGTLSDALQGGGGGGGDVTQEEFDALAAEVAALQAGQISGGTGPVQSDLTLWIKKGNDHTAALGNACEWVMADYAGPDVSGATVMLSLYKLSDYQGDSEPTAEMEVEGTASVIDGTATFSVDVGASDMQTLTTSFPPSNEIYNYRYSLTLDLGGSLYNLLQPSAVKACSVAR